MWKITFEEENDKKVDSSLERDMAAAKQRRMAEEEDLESESESYFSISYDNTSQRS